MPDRLVTLETFPGTAEAGFVKSLLEAEGIRAFVADEAVLGMSWQLGNAIGYAKVQIDEQDLARASEILEGHRQTVADLGQEGFAAEASSTLDLDEASEDESASPASDEAEDEIVDPTEETASRALRAAVFGLAFFPLLFYAAWLIAQLLLSRSELSAAGSRRMWLAAGILLVFFAGFCLVLLGPF